MIFLFLFFLNLINANFTPTGKYCGNIGSIISITAKIKNQNFIDLTVCFIFY
jgi:hypothetical protein